MTSFDLIPPDATEPVATRPLISLTEASLLARLFKVFGNETRLRLLHALVRHEEVCVSDLANALEMKPQAVSNQLQRLVDRGIVAPRRDGTSIYYHIVDPCVPVLLERGLCLTECCPEESTQPGSCCDQKPGACCDAAVASSPKKNSSRPKATKKKSTVSRRGKN